MRRKAIEELYRWKASTDRKPLIVQGARQVGKTWLMKEFAKEAYKKCAYVNFEDNDMLRQLFEHDFDIQRIINSIQWTTGVTIDTDTLIVLDEIQEAPRGITALKYFQEKAPEYHVMAAGSLLGIAMQRLVPRRQGGLHVSLSSLVLRVSGSGRREADGGPADVEGLADHNYVPRQV